VQWKSFAQAGTLPFRPPNHQALRVQSVQARKEQEEAMAQEKPQAAPTSLAGCVEEGRRRTRASKQKPKPSRLSFIEMLLRFSH